MEEIFKFSSQLKLGRDETLKAKPPDTSTNVKRPRTLDDVDAGNLRKHVDSISTLNGEAKNSLNTVDMAGNNNFNVVASKLREAMEVAME
ncbi:hypothetical protein QYF36_016202 [Acer negundo]|nr:hypothetical protein QYF36_016202 [Acer negundo]